MSTSVAAVAAASNKQPKDRKPKTKSKGSAKAKARPNALSNAYVDSDSDLEAPAPADTLVPPGSVLLSHGAAADAAFDYDALAADPDLELCVVRVPAGVKPRHLAGASVSLAPPARGTGAAPVGTLSKKGTAFDFWSVVRDSDGSAGAGGAELLGLTCLLPHQAKDGRLFCSPKPIAHHLVLSAQPALPTPPPDSSPSPSSAPVYASPARYRHPAHLLTHRFLPAGTVPASPPDAEPVAADPAPTTSQATAVPSSRRTDAPAAASPRKKRKADGEAKKAKKAKTAA
ncbi:hypothetical protein DFH11DRAFT_1727201 [Phellopilus nigrolimitatus]|nr:hypothetical protein DFH11DRAFT_1727201 [Phellopilus nigrolimitatus]